MTLSGDAFASGQSELLPEARENLFNAIIASGSGADNVSGNTGDSPFNYGTPRLLRFGAEIRF